MNLKKGLLLLSFVTISVIAMIYGMSPHWFFTTFLAETETPGVDQSHILRAVMGLYIALGGFWLYCAFSEKHQDIGIVVLAVFCGGLVLGRILSVALDGVPSPILCVYIAMELVMVPICIWLLKRPARSDG